MIEQLFNQVESNKETIKIIINFLRQFGIEITEKVIELVQVSYPIVVKQVYAELVNDFISIIFLMGIATISLFVALYFYFNKKSLIKKQTTLKNMLKKEGEIIETNSTVLKLESAIENRNIYILICLCINVLLFLMSLPQIAIIIQTLVNPEWYATKMVVELIQNKGF